MLHLLQTAAEVSSPTDDTYRKAFIGAVAIRRDGVMVASRNGSSVPFKTDGKTLLAHAERRVLRKCGYGAIVYVARVMRNGNLAMAKPCGFCMASLKSRGVEIVYWTVSNTNWEACHP